MPPVQSVDKILARARLAAKARDWVSAQALFQSVLNRFPGNRRARQELASLKPIAVPELLKIAQTAQRDGKWTEAEQSLAAAAAFAPEVAEIGLALGACLLEMGRTPDALSVADNILDRTPGDPAALNLKSSALREMGRASQARECLLSALGHATWDSETLNNLGRLAHAQGDRAAAGQYYRRAIALRPKDTALHRNLAQTITYSADEPHLDEMRRLVAGPGELDPDNAPIHFALFKALDECDARAEAFAHLEKGNRLAKAGSSYDFQTDAVPYALSKVLFRTAMGNVVASGGLRAIFVTGLPRSGTTLTERILARAEGVQPCGELSVVRIAVSRLLRAVVDRTDKSLNDKDIDGLRIEILQGLAEYSDGSPVLIDKMPLNFLWIGYICAALPEAKIVHLSRDPMAVAWSLYRHSFAGIGNGFIYDPANIARFMVLHRDIMAHWHKIFPGRIIDLRYADLVSDTDSATRDLARATGLEWSMDWTTPERASSQILTASADQARRPIYAGSDNGWKRYESQLEPLRKALKSAGVI